jgi:hypothetical protein
VPFQTEVLGVGLTAARIDLTETEVVVAAWRRSLSVDTLPTLA